MGFTFVSHIGGLTHTRPKHEKGNHRGAHDDDFLLSPISTLASDVRIIIKLLLTSKT